MKKFLLIFLVLLISSGIILSCSKTSNEIVRNLEGISDQAYGGASKSESSITPPNESILTNKPRKIIQDGSIDIEVDDPYITYETLFAKVAEFKGYISNSNKTIESNLKRAYIEAKIPSLNLINFLKYIETLGKAKNSYISTNEITRDYYDTQARLDNALVQKDVYQQIMKKSNTIDEILKVQREIDILQERIEQLKGQISLWDNMVDLSTVRITIRQNPRAAVTQNPSKWNSLSLKQWGSYIGKGFISGLNSIVIIFQWLIIILIYPITWIILIIVLLILYFLRKTKK